jgi:hypothetical protein
MRPVDIFHIGPQKTATTWVYRCMSEHPELAGPPRDTIHYFDMYYGKGRDWYAGHFRDAAASQKLFDPTPSYIRSPWAPRRIAQENPGARIVLCLRDPVERAFSHYWHEKKKSHINLGFRDVLDIYDCYANWLEPGFYAEHIERYLRYFPREQLLCQSFDRLHDEPRGFLRELFSFCGVDPDFEPSMLHRRINVAGPRQSFFSANVKPRIRTAFRWVGRIPGLGQRARRSAYLTGKSEYVRGVPPELRGPLAELCEPEIVRLEQLLEIDLSAWREAGPAPAVGTPSLRESLSSQR